MDKQDSETNYILLAIFRATEDIDSIKEACENNIIIENPAEDPVCDDLVPQVPRESTVRPSWAFRSGDSSTGLDSRQGCT